MNDDETAFAGLVQTYGAISAWFEGQKVAVSTWSVHRDDGYDGDGSSPTTVPRRPGPRTDAPAMALALV